MPFEDLLPLYRGEVKTPDGKRCDLWEVFSIPRLGPVIRKMGGQSLRSYDLAHYWDLSEDRYMRLMIQDFGLLKPKFIFLSPPCRYLSPLMHSNWPRMRNYQKKIMSLTEGLHHLDLSMWVAGFQISQGALFALEHPDASLAWSRKSVTLLCFVFYFVTLRYHVFWCWFGKIQSLNFWIISIISMKKAGAFEIPPSGLHSFAPFPASSKVMKILEHPDCFLAQFDQCMFGLKSPNGTPMRKRTKILTNCSQFRILDQQFCDQSHQHVQIQGSENGVRRSQFAQNYPDTLVATLCQFIMAAVPKEDWSLELTCWSKGLRNWHAGQREGKQATE